MASLWMARDLSRSSAKSSTRRSSKRASPLPATRRQLQGQPLPPTEMENNLNPVRLCKKGYAFALMGAALIISACSLKNPGEDVAATVDGQKIYRADVEKYYQNQTTGSAQHIGDEQATSLRLSILEK